MASLGVCRGGGEKLFRGEFKLRFDQAFSTSPSMVSTKTLTTRQLKGRVSTVASMFETRQSQSNSIPINLDHHKQDDDHDQERYDEKLDQWMMESVTEIVKNVRFAPLLIHVYDNGEKHMEKFVREKIWPDVTAQKPEGVILVERLENPVTSPAMGEEVVVVLKEEITSEEVVGVMVQMKGARVGPACYLLKTTRVGPACYYYFMRVKNFKDSARKQFMDSWLVSEEQQLNI